MFNWRDRFLFKKKYLYQAQEFYDKNGGGAIVIARFLPIIRTFAPIVAGIVKMNRAKFSFYNIVGCLAWVTSMLCIGHFLGQAFPSLKNHLELIIIIIVLVTTAPVLYKLFFGKKKEPKD
jgi:membrane-associated protein